MAVWARRAFNNYAVEVRNMAGGRTLYLLTAFLSAFLLFQIQPMLGKAILPWYGGGSEVWSTCLVFFQTALLGGYLYAHGLSLLPSKTAIWIHAAVLGLAWLWLPLGVARPAEATASPGIDALRTLGMGAAFPYVVLAATAPLIQRWYAQRFPEADPYRLYALSNVGSFLALLSYPVLVEPLLGLQVQFWVWSAGFAVFTVACAAAGWRARGGPAAGVQGAGGKQHWILWLLLPAMASALLVATTNQLTQDLAVLPFLWVLPLAVYLLSFVLTFGQESLYRRRVYSTAFAIAAPLGCILTIVGSSAPAWLQILGYCGCLFTATMLCHGELVLTKPPVAGLTGFYLAISAGGAAGGAAVALGAPLTFSGYWEYWIALALVAALILIVWRVAPSGAVRVGAPMQLRIGLAAAAALATLSARGGLDAQIAIRNFYGVVYAVERGQGEDARLELFHGRVRHGMQYLAEGKRGWPTTYFGMGSGAGIALRHHPRRQAGQPLRVAVVGLGAGTLASYGQPGDEFVFYEINPAVVELARNPFHFLSDSKAAIRIVLGDARVNLANELAQADAGRFDVIALDAFTSGSVPTHMLTGEFADILRPRLAEGGLLLFHVSNPAIDLEPVVEGMAAHLGLESLVVVNAEDPPLGVSASEWVAVGTGASLDAVAGLRVAAADWPAARREILWTDDYASLWPLLRF